MTTHTAATTAPAGTRPPYHADAWPLALRTAHQMQRAAGAGHGPALVLIGGVLAVASFWVPHLLLAAMACTAAGMYLLRGMQWGAAQLYPAVLALVEAVGVERATEVCRRHVENPTPRRLLSFTDSFTASIGAQRRADQAADCAGGHAPLCRHRPPVVVEAPPLIQRALYGPDWSPDR